MVRPINANKALTCQPDTNEFDTMTVPNQPSLLKAKIVYGALSLTAAPGCSRWDASDKPGANHQHFANAGFALHEYPSFE